mmetsp:Transcript_23032/g.22897  ORF Transcript_23032/g.22897 Transcript_23032/m.22897 type:complete len:131 (-) Transcript_23032:193-585(-)
MMFRKVGLINKLRVTPTSSNLLNLRLTNRNFSARMKLSQLQRSNKELFTTAAVGNSSQQSLHSNPAAEAERCYDKDLIDKTLENNEKLDASLYESESEESTLQNYVDQEQALKDNMQMINYKNLISDTYQ